MHQLSLVFSPYLHICVWRMNEIFCILGEMSDCRNGKGQEKGGNNKQGYGLE